MSSKEKRMSTERKKKLEVESLHVCQRIKSVFEEVASLHNYIIINDQIDFFTYKQFCLLFSELKVFVSRMEFEFRTKPDDFVYHKKQ